MWGSEDVCQYSELRELGVRNLQLYNYTTMKIVLKVEEEC